MKRELSDGAGKGESSWEPRTGGAPELKVGAGVDVGAEADVDVDVVESRSHGGTLTRGSSLTSFLSRLQHTVEPSTA